MGNAEGDAAQEVRGNVCGGEVRGGDVRVVLADMDDTFLASDKGIPPENLQALDLLAERGIPFVPCTGRPFLALPQEVLAHPATRYAVAINGTSVYAMPSRQLVLDRSVGTARARAIYGRVRDLPATYDIYADGRIYCTRQSWELLGSLDIDPVQRDFMQGIRTPMDLPVEQILDAVGPVGRVGMYWHPGDEATAEAARAAALEDPTLRVTTSLPFGMEVLDVRVSKGTALVWLCEHLGIPQEASMAFGDSMNDLEMIQAAGVGVAMANGEPAVRQAADLVAPTNDEAGFFAVVRRLLA